MCNPVDVNNEDVPAMLAFARSKVGYKLFKFGLTCLTLDAFVQSDKNTSIGRITQSRRYEALEKFAWACPNNGSESVGERIVLRSIYVALANRNCGLDRGWVQWVTSSPRNELLAQRTG